MTGATAMMSNPAMTSFFSVTAPTAANESAVLVQASEVRIWARPGSASSRSDGLVVTGGRLPERRDQHHDRGDDRDHGDDRGQQLRHDRPGQRLAVPPGPRATDPFA